MKLLWFLTCVTIAAWMAALGVGPVYRLGGSADPRIVVLLIGALPGLIHAFGNPHRRRRQSAPLKRPRRPEEPDLDRMIRNQPWYRILTGSGPLPRRHYRYRYYHLLEDQSDDWQ